ncbi:MAG: FtsQ-type POTRA domain-containing protein, partial [Candidatus Buchananbacteria bacterium]|nr:FtsQ-type POTRA domain-containing protein [Candidatus Buchananbacteria bacterium]
SKLVGQQENQRRFFIFSQKNLIFFNKSQLKNLLLKNYPLDRIKINKDLPNTIKIDLTEKPTALVWVSGKNKYYVDFSGIAISQIIDANNFVENSISTETKIIRPETQFGSYPIVIDQNGGEVSIGQTIIKSDLANFINQLNKQIIEQTDLSIGYYSINNLANQDIIAQSKAGWLIYFTATEPVDLQVKELITILQKEITNRNNLEYIDLRFGDKIFYK